VNPAAWTLATQAYVGLSSEGAITVDGSSKLSSASASLGYNAGSSGTVTISGAGSQWTNDSFLNIGDDGSGSLYIRESGVVNNVYAYVGWSDKSSGTVTVTGAGSTWNNSGNLWISGECSGTLVIEDGGQVNNQIGYLGNNFALPTGAIATATVRGANSKWTNRGELHIANFNSRAALIVEAGGQVNCTTGYIGESFDYSGTATISGANSRWTSDVLYVGYKGTLNVGSGGRVAANTIYLSTSSIGTGICNLDGGTLQAGTISSSGPGGISHFHWNDGTIKNNFNLKVNGNLTLELAATGTHAFNIDSGRTGTVDAILRDATTGGTLTKTGLGKLTLTAANTYSGDTFIDAGTLSIRMPYLNDLSGIHIASGAKLDLGFTASDTVGSLYFDGVLADYGSWGSSLSGAGHIDDVHFSGTGMLNVVPESSILALLCMGGLGLFAYGWRRRMSR
jgi:T5SS/PEP-CTERM-associated repeat protein/autotransporter-associated beta strand protein